MKLLDKYFDLQRQIYNYFGYVEDWVVIPLRDLTDFYWTLYKDSSGGGHVDCAETVEKLLDKDTGAYYQNEIYTQKFLKKWVYRAEDFTPVCVDTHTDGNTFLDVFDNSKEIKQ